MVETITCAKCDINAKLMFLPRYDFEEGIPLHHVEAYQCPQCNKIFFTEDQAKAMIKRTEEIKQYSFGFERTVLASGKSLVVGIPNELAHHLRIKKGQKVKITPVEKEGFLVRRMS